MSISGASRRLVGALLALTLGGLAVGPSCATRVPDDLCRRACGNAISVLVNEEVAAVPELDEKQRAVLARATSREAAGPRGDCVRRCRETGGEPFARCLAAARDSAALRACEKKEETP